MDADELLAWLLEEEARHLAGDIEIDDVEDDVTEGDCEPDFDFFSDVPNEFPQGW